MEKALEAIRDWPADQQDDAAEILLALELFGAGTYRASPEELAAIDEALVQIGRGEQPVPQRPAA